MSVIKITKENFESEVINSKKTVLLDFYAVWCGPCQMISPIVAEFAEEHPEYTVGKIDVDEQGELAMKFGIESIPTLISFKDGKILNKTIGFVSKEKILDMMK